MRFKHPLTLIAALVVTAAAQADITVGVTVFGAAGRWPAWRYALTH